MNTTTPTQAEPIKLQQHYRVYFDVSVQGQADLDAMMAHWAETYGAPEPAEADATIWDHVLDECQATIQDSKELRGVWIWGSGWESIDYCCFCGETATTVEWLGKPYCARCFEGMSERFGIVLLHYEDRYPAVTMEEAEIVVAAIGADNRVSDYVAGCCVSDNSDPLYAKNVYIFGTLTEMYGRMQEGEILRDGAQDFYRRAVACELFGVDV